MKRHHLGIILVGLVFGLLPGSGVYAVTITSAADGDWGTGATWDLGEPTSVDFASIQNNVSVTLAGEVSSLLRVGTVGGPGTLTISSGDLTTAGVSLGFGDVGTLNLTGGSLTSTADISTNNVSPGSFTISGGTLLLTGASARLRVGLFGTSVLTVEGGAASITVNSTVGSPGFDIFGGGTLRIRPTGNGAAGLSVIHVTAGAVALGGTIELDTSLYTPQVNDSWDVILVDSGLFSGSFATVVAPEGFTFSQLEVPARGSIPEKFVVTVTGVPAPALPVLGYVGLAALFALLSMAGFLGIRRWKMARQASE